MKHSCLYATATIYFCCSGFSLAQRQFGSSPEQIGEQAISAIRTKNITTLYELVETPGVVVGTDGSRISANSFKQQLLQKRGVYCVLMDASCLPGHQKSFADDSLRGILLRQPVKITAHPVGDASDVVEIAVGKESNSSDVLFSLFLRHSHGIWRLDSIEYN
jgi:hypothetical protein